MEQPVTSTSTYALPEDSRSQKGICMGGTRMHEQTTHLQLVNPECLLTSIPASRGPRPHSDVSVTMPPSAAISADFTGKQRSHLREKTLN